MDSVFRKGTLPQLKSNNDVVVVRLADVVVMIAAAWRQV